MTSSGSAGSVSAALIDVPTPEEAFLEHFPSLNPFSAAALASVDLPLRDLICLPEQQQAEVCALLSSVPERSLRLFWQHCAHGAPTLVGRSCSNMSISKMVASCLSSSQRCSLIQPVCITVNLPVLTSNGNDDSLWMPMGESSTSLWHRQ